MEATTISRREAEAEEAADLFGWAEEFAPELIPDPDEIDPEDTDWAAVRDEIRSARWASDHPHRSVERSEEDPF